MHKKNWPHLSFEKAAETYRTLHQWTQIVGKIKLELMPWINHSWHVTLQVTPIGLTTGSIPHRGRYFQIDLNFIEHKLQIFSHAGDRKELDLKNLSVADCYHKNLAYLEELGVDIKINAIPNEIPDAIPFPENRQRAYDPACARDLHLALLATQEVFTRYRAEFIGKSSPVMFYWGSFDLSITRFSGRKAPLHPGGVPNLPDWVAQEAYSHEVINCGFWPGNEAYPSAAFYSYIYPEPDGFKEAPMRPAATFYADNLGEYLLNYDAVRESDDPDQTLLDFLHSSYENAAGLAGWDMDKLKFTLPKS